LLLETQKKIQEQNTKKKEYYERKERQLTEYRNQISTQDRILSELEQKFVGYEKEEELLQNVMEERARIQSEINQVDQKYESMFSKLKSSSDNKELQLRGQVSELKRDVEKQYTSDIDTLREDINDLSSRYNAEIEKEKNNKHKAEISIATLESNEAKYLTEQEEYVNALESEQKICPTCGQELKNREHLEYKLQSVSEAAERCREAIIKYKKQINAIDKDIMVVTKEFEDNKSAIQSEIDVLFNERNEKLLTLDLKLDTAIQKIQDLFFQKKSEIQSKKNYEKQELSDSLSKIAEEQKSLAEHVHSMKDIEKNIASQKQQRDQVQSWIDRESKEEFDDTELKRAEHQEQSYEIAIQQINQQIEGLNRKKTICEFWEKAFSQTGIPSMLIDESIPFMNERVAYYLDKISNGRYIVSFDTLAETKSGEFRDKISVNVLDTHTQANSRVQLSGGQTRLVDIATILTLSDLQSSTQDVDFNIMLFDEIFDSLDDTNVGYVSRVIRSMISDKSIFIISHRHVDQLEADEVYNYG
jgi:exonuclease SbcC